LSSARLRYLVDASDSARWRPLPSGDFRFQQLTVQKLAYTRRSHRSDANWHVARCRYWNAIVGNGGKESQCGWCKDRWGLPWQITPRTLTEALAAGGGEAKRAFEAMMPMKKIDIATIEAARRG
jgi:hypothetical protein